jgi:uncharacterized protein involved in exopolysaccharide biosynthesis
LETISKQPLKTQVSDVVVDDFDLSSLLCLIWGSKFSVLAISFVFASMSVLYALSIPNSYKSEALLLANSQEKGGGLSSIAGQLGGIASLAGISLGGGTTDKTNYALALMRSRNFLYTIIEEHNLKPEIMAVKDWELSSNRYIFNHDQYESVTKKWKRVVEKPYSPEPSLEETYLKLIEEHIFIYQDQETGIVSITAKHVSPYFAKRLVEIMVNTINEVVKEEEMKDAIRSIKYLQDEVLSTEVSEMQTVFYQLIEKQQQTLMLTKLKKDYVFKVIDGPIASFKKDGPRRAIICLVITIFGIFFAITFVILKQILVTKLGE